MRIGLISDTHGWLDPAIATHFEGVARILHAGDVGREEVLHALEAIAPVDAVRGNVDGGGWARELPLERVVELDGFRIAIRHISGSPGRPDLEARALIKRERPDMLLVGHSHIAVITRAHGTLWVNPGAAGRQGLHRERTVAILELGPEGRFVEMVTLGSR